MIKLFALLSFLLLLTATVLAQATPAPPAPSPQDEDKKDYAQEPSVIEQYRTDVRFEKDGNSRRDTRVRVKIQSDLGVEQWGQLVVGYNSGNEKIELPYVRVLKQDGSTVNADPKGFQDMTAQVARDAPMYTDYREKHITVPSLRPGDTLEYEYVTTTTEPLAKNQFWFNYDFTRDIITRSETVDISVPRDVVLKLKDNPGFDPTVTEQDGRKIYHWSEANLERKTQEERRKDRIRRWRQETPPDIQLTTFRSWEEVGAWYRDLERERVQPDDTVRAKARELTAGKTTDLDKIKALYDFVSLNFRYVSLSFGVGRYQPHSAAEILADRYGDCKDKHTLLASLLDAIGVHAEAALINSSRRLDPDLPSPAQFDHVITRVPLGKDEIWLDTTPEVAPFRVLVYQLRGKQSLVVPLSGTPHLATVPEAIPGGNWHNMDVDATISELGKLTAHVHEILRGDDELYYRSAFRNTPQPYWKDMLQNLTGYRGEFSDIKAGDLNTSDQPFEVSYTVSVPNAISISSKHQQMIVPVPYMLAVPDQPDEDDMSYDQQLPGAPAKMTFHVKVAVPEAYAMSSPVPITVKRDYGSYTSTYVREKNVLTIDRELVTTQRQLPGSRAKDYYAFARAVRSDQEQQVALDRSGTVAEAAVPKGAKIDELIETGGQALRNEDLPTAAAVFKAATETDPKNWRGWAGLGLTYTAQQKYADAEAMFQKVIELDPYSETAYRSLAFAYTLDRKFPEAEAAYKRQLEVTPLDAATLRGLAGAYVEERKFADAIPPLEQAASLEPREATTQTLLGQCYLETKQQDKAIAALNRAVDISAEPTTWNDVAYMLAQHDLQLDRARQYAESAVTSVAAELRNVDLNDVTLREIGLVSSLSAYWDTLGWVHFHDGDVSGAEKFVTAALMLSNNGELLDHLGEIREKQGRTDDALRAFALALSVRRSYPEARPRLVKLAGGENQADEWIKKVAPDVDQRHGFGVRNAGAGASGSADFLLLLGPDKKIEAAHFLSGDDTMKSYESKLTATPYDFPFPDGTPTKIVSRATLTCKQGERDCHMVLIMPDDTTSVN